MEVAMTKRMLILSLLVVAVAGGSVDAAAQRRAKGGGGGSKAKPAAAATSEGQSTQGTTTSGGVKQTNYDFDDDLVNGDLVRPDGEQLTVRRRGERRSLVRLREHFIPEMLKSVEDL